MAKALDSFHPLVREWFETNLGTPTPVQGAAWPEILGRKDVLVTAPTGSGKTLTAFLCAIDRFIKGEVETGATRVLYISPLKALNNDIRRNLLRPLEELRELFDANAIAFPDIRVQTRSGDTTPEDRRRMIRHPPEILITTPESLNLLLSSASGESILTGIDTVILDEIHGVVGSKRGAYLMGAVERLVPLSGEFQRIALSATVSPLESVATFVGGYHKADRSPAVFTARPVTIVSPPANKSYDLSIRYPDAAAERPEDEKVWESLASDFVGRIRKNRSTLLFVNSRAICERVTFLINQAAGELLAWAHHGSLSREIRFEVEQKLKAGQLKAIVATGTLEMGIDIGALDEVILIQSPDGVSSTIQRIGRAGHSVGEVSHGTIYPTHPMDFIEAAALVKAVEERDIEPVHFIECPLDVLAQGIISMTGLHEWNLDELYDEVRRSTPFHALTRTQFDLTVNMLAGRYEDNHVRELRARIIQDRLNNTIKARPGALMSLYLSGGVIPDRGYFQLRLEENNARLGELDEEFVWEAQAGKVFSMGTQHWQVKKITHNDVIVAPAHRTSVAPPFWKAEPISRDFHFASRVGDFLKFADAHVDDETFENVLASRYHMEPVAARETCKFLSRQRSHTGAPLPHRHHLLVEKIERAPGKASGTQIVLHTFWGARVNRPLAMALEAGWYEAEGGLPEVYVANDSIVIQLPGDVGIDELLALVPVEKLEQRLRLRLEGSGFFGARFRENAGRALILAKGKFNERKPLWMSRLQSQKLLDAVLKYEDFPMLLETWRTCLRDEFDLPGLRAVLGEVARGEIRVTEVASQTPSPFAHSVAWDQVNTYMYMDDTPRGLKSSNLRTDLIEEVVFSPALRPRLPASIIESFELRRQRLVPGYEPEGEEETREWVKERTAIPQAEWTLGELPPLVETLVFGDASLIVASEDRSFVQDALTGSDPEATATCVANWLQYYGPLGAGEIEARLGIGSGVLQPVLDQLEADRTIVSGPLRQGDDSPCYCDAANYETLLRFLRQAARVSLPALPIGALPLFLYRYQTRFDRKDRLDKLFQTLERLAGYPAPPGLWESEILPARLPDFVGGDLDAVFAEGNLQWIGTPDKHVAFWFRDDLDLATQPDGKDPSEGILASGRHDFGSLMDETGLTAAALGSRLWEAAWQGRITNDSIAALRKGIENNFEIPEGAATSGTRRRNIRRGSFNAWRAALPSAGNWYRIAYPQPSEDLLEKEEAMKDRARILLARYGVVFRELLQREAPGFGFRDVFRSLRLMELAGEVVSGYFFEDIPGPQFASQQAYRLLQRELPKDEVFWINAADPISLCGTGLDAVQGLPRRIPGNHLVYRGPELALTSERGGKSLTIKLAPDHDDLPRCLTVLRHLLYRSFLPRRNLVIETINDEPSIRSPYRDALATAFDLHQDHKAITIERHL